MYNTSTLNISYNVIENGQSVLAGQIPYALLPVLKNAVLFNSSRTLEITIGNDTYTIATNYQLTEDPIIEDQFDNIYTRAYISLSTRKEIEEAEAQVASTAAIFAMQQEEELRTNEENRLRQQLEEAEMFYRQSLEAQLALQDGHERSQEEEAYRLDMLRVEWVQKVAVDPALAVDALMSEVGSNGDVRRQVAFVMDNNEEIARTVVASTSTLWSGSYEIMEVVARKAVIDPELAQLLDSILPVDSMLRHSLERLGYIN